MAACSASPVEQPTAVIRSEPSPQRAVVELRYDVADDLRTVTGREAVVFTPDQPICELVFRAWPNKPTTADDGTSLRITDALVDARPVEAAITPGGAPEGAPGTIVTLPLPACIDAGTEVRAELGFTLALGEDAGERVGHTPSAELAWFATAFPLLAWVSGEGWVRDPAVDLAGETVTSEDFTLAELAVTAPQAYRVLGTGRDAGTGPGARSGTVEHRFRADAVRDVAVSVGRFTVVERDVGGVRYHVGVPESGSRLSADEWADELENAVRRLQDMLGAYPYTDLWASILPALSDGVEFPSALQFGDVNRRTMPALVAHEVAHMWFYGLVGNNQARHPWIDESFATYAQARVAGQEDDYAMSDIDGRLRGHLGEPMPYWAATGNFNRYVTGVYDQGAAVLLEGRRRSGDEAFDSALRAYIAANAHRVAGPADVAAAFGHLPEVMTLLRRSGALPQS